jgi:hypothetical protein
MRSIRLALLAAFLAPVALVPAPSAYADGAVFTPTTYDDHVPDGCSDIDCTLREAVIAAEDTPGKDYVYLLPGTYVLQQPISGTDTRDTGDLDITTDVQITGVGATPDSTVIDANYIDRGFDIYPGGTLFLYGVTIEHGRAQIGAVNHSHGGGIHNHGTLTLVDSSLSQDCAAANWGGGGLTNAATATLQSVTVVGDCAGTNGQGGGIENRPSATLKLFNVTIAENSADAGHVGGLWNDNGATARLNNTIVATNFGGGAEVDCGGVNPITSVGHNLAGDGTCNLTAAGDIPASDPLFEAALVNGDNVSYLFTLLPISPALDAGSALYSLTTDVGCPGPVDTFQPIDEIGTARPQDGNDDGVKRCDIGAYERPDPPPTVKAVSPQGTAVPAGANVKVSFSEPMNQPAAQGAFSVVRNDTSAAVSGAFSWSGNTMVFDPGSSLVAGRTYTARVTTAATDSAGVQMQATKQWQFTIARVIAFPASTVIVFGSLRDGGAGRLQSDDNSYYQVNSTTSGTRTTSWYGVFSGVPNGLGKLQVTYKGKNSVACDQRLALYNWTTSSWQQVDSHTVGTTEVGITVSPGGTLADLVSGRSGLGDLRFRVACRVASPSFFASGDLMKISYAKP